MKKNVLALLIASSIGLYGCGDESELTGNPTIDPGIEKSLQAETKIVFDILSKKKVPIMPSFLVVDTYDGTLKTDGDLLSTDPENKYSKDISNPKVALGKTDGWGTLEPITIDFKGQQLKAETAINSFVLIESFDPSPRSKPDTTKPSALTYGVDYIITVIPVRPAESKLVVSLLKPLKPSANYMFAITDDLKDIKGHSVGMTGSYATLKTTATPPDARLKQAQDIVHITEATIAATTGVNAQNIIFSTWFTTASVGNSLHAAKAAIALSADAVVKTTQGTTPGNAAPVWGTDIPTTGMFSFTKTTEVTDYPGKATGVNKYTGTVKLPYFLAAYTETDSTSFRTTPWSSATPSLAKVMNVIKREDESSNILIAQLTSKEIGITPDELITLKDDPSNKTAQLSVIKKLINKKLYLDKDKKVRLDEERLITKYSPIPQLRSVADVPYNLYMPSTEACKNADANNIPVNIFTHGFTSNNDSADYYAAATISQKCQALIAIDLPLHGDRWHGKPEEQTLGFMNLKALPVARDNIRQSITDLMSLRASLGILFGAKGEHSADTIKHLYGELGKLSLLNGATPGVGYVGISLGGIVGIGYTATIDKPVIFDEAGEVDIKKETALFKASRAHFDVPGGAIAYFLFDSKTFGPTVQAALKADDGYKEYKAEECSGLSDAACDSLFFNSFAFAAQSVLDTIDPANYINQIQTPVYLSMAEGDKVIPNGPITGTLKSAVAGTLPMIVNGNLNMVDGEVEKVTRNSALYREEYSFHGALATPPTKTPDPIKYAPAIADMQKNSMTFLSQGKLPVEKPEYLYQLN